MRFLLLILSAFLATTAVQGQTAKFYADTTRNWMGMRNNPSRYERVMEMEWKMNGQTLRWGSKPIEVTPDPNKVDTLFFRVNSNAKWDTMICIIKKPEYYKFIYNECCGAFNIEKEGENRFLYGTVTYKITDKADKKTYLGTLGEAGLVVNSTTTDTLRPGCRSAMSPNVYPISFSEIEICKDTANCREGTCMYDKKINDYNYDFGYKTVSKKLNVLFLP